MDGYFLDCELRTRRRLHSVVVIPAHMCALNPIRPKPLKAHVYIITLDPTPLQGAFDSRCLFHDCICVFKTTGGQQSTDSSGIRALRMLRSPPNRNVRMLSDGYRADGYQVVGRRKPKVRCSKPWVPGAVDRSEPH